LDKQNINVCRPVYENLVLVSRLVFLNRLSILTSETEHTESQVAPL